jgi:hypothetical protein
MDLVPNDAHRLIRFVRAEVRQLTKDSCQAAVEIDLRGIGPFTATAAGPVEELDQLRTVARATADALSAAFDARGVKVRVVSVQLVASLTQRSVLATVAVSRGSDHRNLLGVCDATRDPVKAAALAVLNATNRFLAL